MAQGPHPIITICQSFYICDDIYFDDDVYFDDDTSFIFSVMFSSIVLGGVSVLKI